MGYGDLKKRYAGLDLYRVVTAIIVCMFHTTIHLNCNYGFFQSVANIGSVFMTAFFLLSGFSLFVNWSGICLSEPTNIKMFLKKRIISIMPMYLFVTVIYAIIEIITEKETVIRTAAFLPIIVLGLQSVYPSFNFSHTGGTWFISCMLICYLIYPFFQELIIHTSKRTHIVVLFLCTFFLLYSPYTVFLFHIPGIYSNPFFRFLEFLVGMLIGVMKIDCSDSRVINRGIDNWLTILIVNMIMFVLVSWAGNKGFSRGNYIYIWICLPCFMILLLGLSGVNTKKIEESRIIYYLSKITYVFYLAQLFSNAICKEIIQKYEINNNCTKIMLGWSVCIIITVIFRFVEIELQRIIRKRIQV